MASREAAVSRERKVEGVRCQNRKIEILQTGQEILHTFPGTRILNVIDFNVYC